MNETTLLSIDEMAALTAGASMWSTAAIPHAGIPALAMADGPMGVAGPRVDERDVSLLTPAPVALGASWDRELVQRIGRLVGGEAIRRKVDLMLAPNLNLARSPLAGRAFEYFSEDPLLCGVLGASWIQGCQSVGTGAVANAGREVLTGGRGHSLQRAAAIVGGFPGASLADRGASPPDRMRRRAKPADAHQPQRVATMSSVYPSGAKLIHAVDTQ